MEVVEQIHQLRDGRSACFRALLPEHAALYRDYTLSVAHESPWSGMVPSEVRSEDEQRELFAKPDEHRRHWRLGVFDETGALVIGDCSMARSDRVKFGHVARLGIGIREGWRGQGLGRRMMEAAIEAARRDPAVLRLELMVFAKNEIARNLYRSVGFLEEGVNIRSVRQPDGSFDDDVNMAMWVGD
ncbi:MAG: GNAT family N-acetyltransferase [Phycisphaerales bacterium]|nr:GNAT family N-acetyltransferase [Phycisphaerales bacterium]